MAIPYERAVEEDLNLGTGTVTVTMPGGGTATGNQINLGTFGLAASASWNPGSIAAHTTASTTITISGARVGDPVLALFSGASVTAGLIVHARVTADDTVTLFCTNATAGAIAPPSGTATAWVFRVAA